MNRIDRIIAAVSPERAVKRQEARQKLNVMNSGYGNHGASIRKNSLLGWMFGGGSPDEDIVDNLDTLRQRSRDLYMGGATLATGAIKTARTNVVGTGLKLKPAPDAEVLGLSEEEAADLKKRIVREFNLWADSEECDAARRDDFYGLQQLAFLSQILSGDVFALLPYIKRKPSVYDLRIRLIEADRCCDPPIRHDKDIRGGVEVDEYGAVVAYHFVNKHPLGTQDKVPAWTRVEAFGAETGRRNVLHLFETERPEQRRGVPLLAPVIEAFKQLGRYSDAELMSAVISSMFTVFVQTENPATPAVGSMIPESQQLLPGDQDTLEMGNGTILQLEPGQTVKEANPSRPNTAFDAFVTAILRQVGAALEIPYELMIKNFTSSYSASRAALMEAWKMFRMRRAWLASDFCQPVYEEWFAEAVAKGRIPAPGFFDDPIIRRAYTRAEWHGPSAGQIDPLKEAQAAKLRVDEEFSTREREAAELTGGDFEQIHAQRVREEKLRRQDGLLIGGGEQPIEQSKKVLDDDQESDEE